MIIYQATKQEFLHHVRHDDIEDVILRHYQSATGSAVARPQMQAWSHSLAQMGNVLDDEEIPGDAGVAIEYQVPQTSKRIDFLISGHDAQDRPRVVIVELKQWSSSRLSDKDGIIWAQRGGRRGDTEGPHPSYQAWSYAALLQDFNEEVYTGGIEPQPCAYLHNYRRDGVIDHPNYAEHIKQAPLFLREDRAQLQAFIKLHVRRGDRRELLYRMENGRIRPSKMLADSVRGLMQGRPEFILVDDQKLVYETAMQAAVKAITGRKQVVIVQGGPGTGKSVVAVNLLAACLGRELNARYVSKNAAPREVYRTKLAGTFTQTRISNLFNGSGSFVNTAEDSFDALIVDEAHRLNEKGGLYGNVGDHQVKELIRSARCTVFFVDDDQRVTLLDVGSTGELRRWARELDADVTELELASQFRCSGSDGYLAWLDNTLSIRETANPVLDVREYDFRVFDTPGEVHSLIELRNRAANRARVVAGYCWPWNSKRDPQAWDIDIPEHGYRRRWNLGSDGSLWIVAERSVEQVGCIHTCQGLEVEYIGVIIGPDLVYRDGMVQVDVSRRARSDKTIKGLKKIRAEDPARAQALGDAIVKNTYRTLMTRGMKGCYVYCADAGLRDFLRSRLRMMQSSALTELPQPAQVSRGNVVALRRVSMQERAAGVPAAPLVELRIAAGGFSAAQSVEELGTEWAALPDFVQPQPGLFVAQITGQSMNRRIPDGAWCLFRANPQGTREGKIVVVQHRSIEDPETGASYTIKRYASEKVGTPDGSWQHTRIRLRPDSDQPHFKEIVVDGADEGEFRVVAEFLMVL
ncbi:MAG: DNA/RNA helicase domain-containing protein [Pseudomonadota bacterium]